MSTGHPDGGNSLAEAPSSRVTLACVRATKCKQHNFCYSSDVKCPCRLTHLNTWSQLGQSFG